MRFTRRAFLKTAAAASVASALPQSLFASEEQAKVKVAAIQMHCNLGDVDINLEKAERWVREAIRQEAKWIVLPEFFTSGMGRHDVMLDAHRPIDGEPAQLLARLAKVGKAYVGGSFLAESDGDVFNTFMLATPDGQILQHDKDFPSMELESSYYAGGEDAEYVRELQTRGIEAKHHETIRSRALNNVEGIFDIGEHKVGCALCWEQLRFRTMQRIAPAKPDLLLAASCWAALDKEIPLEGMTLEQLGKEFDVWQRQVIDAPSRLAKMLGCPVVHANTCGETWSANPDRKSHFLMRWLGESQIVDGRGVRLAHRPRTDGEGLVIAEVNIGNIGAVEAIPETDTWTPDTTEFGKSGWYSGKGRDYYFETTRDYRRRANRESD